MKKIILRAICIKNIIIWSVISFGCLLAEGVFVKQYLKDTAAGKDIFLPGVLALALAVFAFLFFGVTRVRKYVTIVRQNG